MDRDLAPTPAASETAVAADTEARSEEAAAELLFAEGTIPGLTGSEGADGDGDGDESVARALSASELAYDAGADSDIDTADAQVELDEDATSERSLYASTGRADAEATSAEQRRPFRYSGEPLPALKEILQGKLGSPKANLRAFLEMWQQATVRRGTGGARTFISPADGLAGIITGVILSIVNKYRGVATARQRATLDRVLANHLTLLSTPLSRDGRSGGHRVAGVKRQGKGIAGPALNHGNSVRLETVNQTAVVLLGLERLAMNPELQPVHKARVAKLIAALTPEFKACLVKCYSGRDVHDWHYGLSSRLEDQGHLKTTWDMMMKLARTKSRAAEWYEAQAERIARLWPRVTGPWDGLTSAAGNLPHTG